MKFIDITGLKFNRLTVISRVEGENKKKVMWLCECECESGKMTTVNGANLKNGAVKSCGCLLIEVIKNRSITHGKRGTRIYSIYAGMKSRCYNTNGRSYKDYGARGIVICDEWIDDFNTFYSWSIDNGYSDELSIDRIDYNGNYEPSNCRWATFKVQQNNKRSNTYVEIEGQRKPISVWAKENNIGIHTIRGRIKLGWTGVELIQPLVKKKLEKQSGVPGVAWYKKTEKWHSYITKDKKRISIGFFKNLDEAIQARSDYLDCGIINIRKTSSGISGISWDKKKNKWHVYINEKGKKRINIGLFVYLEEAKLALKEHKELKYINYVFANEQSI